MNIGQFIDHDTDHSSTEEGKLNFDHKTVTFMGVYASSLIYQNPMTGSRYFGCFGNPEQAYKNFLKEDFKDSISNLRVYVVLVDLYTC